MVRKSELNKVDSFTAIIDSGVRKLVQNAGMTTYDLAKVIGRSQSYAALRYAGDQSWTTGDLERIASCLGYVNAFGLLDAIRGTNKQPVKEQQDTPAARTLAVQADKGDKLQALLGQHTEFSPDPEFPADWAELAADHDPNKRAESETPEE